MGPQGEPYLMCYPKWHRGGKASFDHSASSRTLHRVSLFSALSSKLSFLMIRHSSPPKHLNRLSSFDPQVALLSEQKPQCNAKLRLSGIWHVKHGRCISSQPEELVDRFKSHSAADRYEAASTGSSACIGRFVQQHSRCPKWSPQSRHLFSREPEWQLRL